MSENKKIIGNRADVKNPKSMFIGLIALAIIGLILVGITFVTGGNSNTKMVLAGMGLFIVLFSIIMAVMLKLQDKKNASMKGTPTIVLNDDSTLTLYLLKGKEERVALDNIAKVKFKARLVASSNGFINTYTWQEDGIIVLKLKDGRTIKVPQVDKGADVEKMLNTLTGNF